jgi:hypothetical protein
MSLPRDQLPRKCNAERALRLRSGSKDAASLFTDEMRLLVFTQRAATRSMADLLILGLGEVARVRSTSRGIAAGAVSLLCLVRAILLTYSLPAVSVALHRRLCRGV